MKEDIETLLERRKKLREQINEMEKEYGALGRVITKILKVTEEEKQEETINRVQKQINEQTRNGRTQVCIDNKDLGFISRIAMSEGRSYIEANQLQSMIDDYER